MRCPWDRSTESNNSQGFQKGLEFPNVGSIDKVEFQIQVGQALGIIRTAPPSILNSSYFLGTFFWYEAQYIPPLLHPVLGRCREVGFTGYNFGTDSAFHSNVNSVGQF